MPSKTPRDEMKIGLPIIEPMTSAMPLTQPIFALTFFLLLLLLQNKVSSKMTRQRAYKTNQPFVTTHRITTISFVYLLFNIEKNEGQCEEKNVLYVDVYRF